ncbi:MAG: OB-fold nucleic acid binding domain-containing protein [Polyangiales bacterium]
MGLRYVHGLGEVEKEKLRHAPYEINDLLSFMRETGLRSRASLALAKSGAFDAFGICRRDAIWQIRLLDKYLDHRLPLSAPSSQMHFASLNHDDEVLWDHQHSHHSARGHPMQRFRRSLQRQGILDAKLVRATTNGATVRYVGLVICRQRPATASGVTFFTLEDETGFVNLVVWKNVFEHFSTIAKTAALLGVEGEVQKQEGVVHLIARRLWIPESLFAPPPSAPAIFIRDVHWLKNESVLVANRRRIRSRLCRARVLCTLFACKQIALAAKACDHGSSHRNNPRHHRNFLSAAKVAPLCGSGLRIQCKRQHKRRQYNHELIEQNHRYLPRSGWRDSIRSKVKIYISRIKLWLHAAN